MRFRRRRRPRVVWLQNTGTELGTGRAADPYDNASATEFFGQVNVTAGTVISIPLVLDTSPKFEFVGSTLPNLDNTGLNQNIEYGYLLRRIVGKYALAFRALDAQGASFPGVWAKLALMVRKVTENTGLPMAPVGSQDSTRLNQVSDPWIWQRSHFFRSLNGTLSTQIIPEALDSVFTQFQNSTQEVGGTKDDPAFDIKTARRVAPEERLFMEISLQGLPLDVPAATDGNDNTFMYFICDYRVLGTVLTNVGNKRNASR